MTVKELIELLEKCEPEKLVYLAYEDILDDLFEVIESDKDVRITS